ncbi:hypothetical protein FSP39_020750 [Pinctada imbricata]|uniref:Protein RRP5 homolog n=1 Tax=Pinctada imbricata TaxID=66713 RepID=A0AA88Y1I9_PINIB|nr:hypothetical protein FSP39_020750 [Pinctada imbricata]
MVVLGCVKEVREYEVMMGLPNNLSGSVPITNISEAYKTQLHTLTQAGDVPSEDVADLNELFKPGMFLPCKVMSVKKVGWTKLNIQLSINPKDVYQQLTAASIRSGMAMYGNVSSREDHGYIIDLGVKNIKAFLKNKDAEKYIQDHNEGDPLSVGRPVLCRIETDIDHTKQSTGETRAINVTIDPKKVKEAQTKETKNLNWLIAGMKVPAKVKKIVATILYIHPTSKLIVLTCLDHIVNYDGVPSSDRFGSLEMGTVIEEAKILRIEKNGIYLKLGDKIRGFASPKNLSNEEGEGIEKVYKKGTTHRYDVQYILIYLFIYNFILALNKEFVIHVHVKKGNCCTVENVGERGVTVRVTSHIQGLIPTLHLADVPLKHPEKKFEKGKKLKCRVLTVDKAKQKVKLTHKKSLVNSKYAPLTSMSQLEVGLEAEGFIADVKDKGCLVVFYNDMKGWVPLKELSTEYIPLPQKVFYKGQVVRCRVKSWSDEDKKITLTFKLEGKPNFGTKLASAPDNFEIGKLTDCRVKAKSDKGLDVELLPSKLPAFIPIMHLSDSKTTHHMLLDTYKPGDLIRDAVYLSRTNVVEGMIVPASVKKLMDFGIFVKLPGNLDGLIPNKFAVDRRLDNLSTVYYPGQPVQVKVTTIDNVKGRFLGSFLMSDCYNGDTDIGLDLMENYWNDNDKICQHLGRDKDVSIKAGDKVEAVVIYADVTNKSLEFSLDPELVNSIKSYKPTKTTKKGVIRLTDIADVYTDNLLADYKRGQYLQCYVKSAKDKENCHLSLRSSRLTSDTTDVEDPEVTMETLSAGQVLQGFVTKYQDKKILIRMDTSSKLITLSIRESETGIEEKIPEELKSTRAPPSEKFKQKHDRKRRSSESDDINSDKASKQKRRKRSESENSDSKGDIDSESLSKKRTKAEKRKKKGVDSELSDSVNKKVKELKKMTDSDSDSGISGVDGVVKDKDLPRLAVMSEFSWDTEFTLPTEEGKLESDEESESDSETFERQQLDGEVTPQVAEDFDKLVLQSPNSSMVWLRYMAHHLETTEIEKARAVAERALKTISFREEQEKFNVWVGYLNLENMYGTPELLKKVLDRALKENEPLNVYQQMVNIYVKSGKMEEAEQLYNIMTKKLGQNKDVWRGFGDFYFRNQRAESARKLLQRSLKSLEQKYHVETISKFAQMEFKHGEPERGKTMFENILSNYPKRTDLWSVYIDMVTKLGEIENTRQIFERVINLKLSAKKMKFFFKKYLDFEKAHGDSESIEEVKNKALTYVESKGYVED